MPRRYSHDPVGTTISLVGIAELAELGGASSDNHSVVIRIDATSDTGDDSDVYYVAFNRATGINVGTGQNQDQVLVVSQEEGGYKHSYFQAGLSEGESYEIKDIKAA